MSTDKPDTPDEAVIRRAYETGLHPAVRPEETHTTPDAELFMRSTLLAAAKQFARYAAHHDAKGDADKSAENHWWADRCRDAAQ